MNIFSTVSSCMSRLGQINRVKHIFDKCALFFTVNVILLFFCLEQYYSANLDKLQAVQNFACHILCSIKTFNHITPLLKVLCWLPIRQAVYFRVALLVFKCMFISVQSFVESFYSNLMSVLMLCPDHRYE